MSEDYLLMEINGDFTVGGVYCVRKLGNLYLMFIRHNYCGIMQLIANSKSKVRYTHLDRATVLAVTDIAALW